MVAFFADTTFCWETSVNVLLGNHVSLVLADTVSGKLQNNNIYTIAKRNVEGQDMLYQSLKLTNGIWILAELRIQPGNPNYTVITHSAKIQQLGIQTKSNSTTACQFNTKEQNKSCPLTNKMLLTLSRTYSRTSFIPHFDRILYLHKSCFIFISTYLSTNPLQVFSTL